MSAAAFAKAVRMAESGTAEGNYGAVRGVVRNARLLGAYGIPSDEWDGLAAAAGIAGATWKDPAAQDKVARMVFDDLYRKYGDWRLVAVAWKAGEDAADKIAADPSALQDDKLKRLKEYVESTMGYANAAHVSGEPSLVGSPGEVDTTELFPQSTADMTGSEGMSMPQGTATGEAYMARMLTAMRNGQRRRREGRQAAEPEAGQLGDVPQDEPEPQAEPVEGG